MKADIVKQEILLVITSFHHKELCKKNAPEDSRHDSFAEQLEEACWNGLLDELLGGIVKKNESGERLSLWHIQQGKFFLELELCNYPQATEKQLSIDPYVLLSVMPQN